MTVSSVLGYSLFSASSFLFFLAFIFAVCGYFTPWLVPKEQYATEDQPQIESVGLKQVCFKDFRFSFHFDPRSRDVFDSCYDNQRNSAKFDNIAVDVWSPRWFQIVQDMHLACVIMLVFNLLLMGGFVAIYLMSAKVKRKGRRQAPCLVMTKCGLALWFILAFVIGILYLVEAIMFVANYNASTNEFYYSEHHTFSYGPGFGLTIGAGLCLMGSGGIGAAIFCGIVRNLFTKGINGPQYAEREDSYYSQDSHSRHSMSEMDRLSNHRKDPDGEDESEVIENYATEPPKPAHRKSIASLHYQDTGEEKSSDGRPVPAPRRSMSHTTSRDPSVTPSQSVSQYNEGPPTYTDLPHHSQPATGASDVEMRSNYAPSYTSSARSPSKPLQYDYKPGYGYVPKSAQQRPDNIDISPHSASHRSSLQSPYQPPAAGGHLYVPPSRVSHGGSMTGYSDTESMQSDRNRSVTRSSVARSPQAPTPTSSQKVVKPKSSDDPKHSRYAASGW